MLSYDEWLEEVELQVWYILSEDLGVYYSSDELEELHGEGYDPDDVVEMVNEVIEDAVDG